jgi:hypothetical protein
MALKNFSSRPTFSAHSDILCLKRSFKKPMMGQTLGLRLYHFHFLSAPLPSHIIQLLKIAFHFPIMRHLFLTPQTDHVYIGLRAR